VPWFEEYIKPYKAVYITKYLRAGSMCYWGAVIALLGKGRIAKADKAEKARSNKCDAIKKAKPIATNSTL